MHIMMIDDMLSEKSRDEKLNLVDIIWNILEKPTVTFRHRIQLSQIDQSLVAAIQH